VLRIGTNDCYGRSGTALEMLEYTGLTAENIAAKAREAIAKKK
jgi:transketolase